MAEVRDPTTITEELSDLRRYIKGLPKHLLETGAFVAYQKREALLHEELVASQLYRVVGKSLETEEPFVGLKEQMVAIVQRVTDFQDELRLRTKVRKTFLAGLSVVAMCASLISGYFVAYSESNPALIGCGVCVLLIFLDSIFEPRTTLATSRILARNLEAMKLQLQEYVKVDDTESSDGMVKRELLLAMIKEIAETKSMQLSKP
jgi:hypothetical protein